MVVTALPSAWRTLLCDNKPHVFAASNTCGSACYVCGMMWWDFVATGESVPYGKRYRYPNDGHPDSIISRELIWHHEDRRAAGEIP